MKNYLQLPQFNPGNQQIDFSAPMNALEGLRQQNNLQGQIQRQQEEQTYQRGREAKQDARSDEQFQMQRQEGLAKRMFAFAQQPPEMRDPRIWTALVQEHAKYHPGDGMDPDDLDVRTGPDKFGKSYAAAFGGIARDPMDEKIKAADLAYKQAGTQKLLADSKGGQSTRGLQLTYGYDEAGNVVAMQPSSTGELVPAKLPPGVRLDPGAAGIKARNAAAGKWEGGEDQRTVGKQRLTDQLSGMVNNYLRLDESGGIVNPDKSGLQNLQARARASGIGQMVGGAVGTQEQSIRNQIENVRPLLMQGIMQASGMSARALDSNRELDFYLRSATDPTQDIYANLVAIDVLDQTYGLGNVLAETVPPEILARVKQDAARAIQSRPIRNSPPAVQPSAVTQQPQAAPPGDMQPRQAPDGNFYIPDPNRPGKYLRVE